MVVLPVSAVEGTEQKKTSEQTEAYKAELRLVKEKAKAEIKEIKDRKKEEFQQKIGLIKDEKKEAIATKLNEKLCEVSDRRTTQMLSNLNKMREILARVEARAAAVETRGVDTTSVKAEIAQAKLVIDQAEKAVEAVAANPCGLNTSGSDTAVKNEAANAIKTLETHLRSANVKVKEARKATTEAIKSLADVIKSKAAELKPTGGAE